MTIEIKVPPFKVKGVILHLQGEVHIFLRTLVFQMAKFFTSKPFDISGRGRMTMEKRGRLSSRKK